MTNDDLTNCELSTEELEAIAAGWPHWLHSVVNAVENVVSTGLHDVAVAVSTIEKYVKINPPRPWETGRSL